ncbi:YkoF family thiamine/hydroxymethylpyrimidine-binding protein [Rhizobium sp. Pop5]|uniref:YkoF family thiamine/hydroxymethylpyrimidine-binding protein n=1 Tax=Rhizobium sp. Pop5 TaxID=1223565 RepID=UPI000283BB16|nr:hypothetical protein RCCGEPOP_11803 [Rhizobium sp. Pop5]
MFSGAQVSLYPMSGNFVGFVLDAVKALDPFFAAIRTGTSDRSRNFCTTLGGDAGAVFANGPTKA